MEKRLNRVLEMISNMMTSAEIDQTEVLAELDLLKAQMVESLISNSYLDEKDPNEETGDLLEKLQELQGIYIENKVNLQNFQESLSLILPDS